METCRTCDWFEESDFFLNCGWCNYHDARILNKDEEVCEDYQ